MLRYLLTVYYMTLLLLDTTSALSLSELYRATVPTQAQLEIVFPDRSILNPLIHIHPSYISAFIAQDIVQLKPHENQRVCSRPTISLLFPITIYLHIKYGTKSYQPATSD